MSVEFNLTEAELPTADLGAETAGLTNVEKVEWAYIYTHKAANLQGKLKNAYDKTTIAHVGYDVPVPQAARDFWRAMINALADRIVIAQTTVANITD